MNRGEGRFRRAEDQRDISAVGWAYGAALVDLDNDGWLDLYACSGFVSHDRTRPDG